MPGEQLQYVILMCAQFVFLFLPAASKMEYNCFSVDANGNYVMQKPRKKQAVTSEVDINSNDLIDLNYDDISQTRNRTNISKASSEYCSVLPLEAPKTIHTAIPIPHSYHCLRRSKLDEHQECIRHGHIHSATST